MKKKKKKEKEKLRKQLLKKVLTVGENMPEIKPIIKPKHTKKHLAKLYRAIKVFVRGISKRKKDIRGLAKVPIAALDIRFDYPDIVKFKKRRKKSKRVYQSGNIEIENDQILGAFIYNVKVNPKTPLGKEILLTKKEKREEKKRRRKEEKDGKAERIRQKREKKAEKKRRQREKE